MPEKKTAEKKPAVKKTVPKTATKKTATKKTAEKTEAEKKTAAKKKTAANKTAAKAAAAEKKTAAKATAAEKKAAITEKKAVTTKKAAAVKKETSEKKTPANKTAANKTAAKKTASGKTTEKKTAEKKATEKKTAEKKIIEKKTTDTEKKSSAKKTAEKKTDTVKTASEKKSTDKKARTVKADDKKPVAKEKKAAKEESPKEETKKAPSGRGRKKKAEEPARLTGKIRNYRWDKHFGFISTEDADFFFHVNDLQEKKARIKPGMEVSFEFIENEKGRHAVNIAFTGNIIKLEDNKSGVNETDIKEKQSSEKQKSSDGNGASKKEADKKTKEAAPSKKPANKKESAENKAEPVEDAPKKETRNTRKKYRQPDKKDEGEYGVDYQLSWLGKEYTIIDKDCVSRYSNGRANSIIIAHEEVREPQEIDEIVVSEGGVFLIETKRYSGETSINSNGNWILTTRGEKQGIMSPVAQTYRHRMIMRTILEGLVDDKYIYDIICIAKDDAIIEGEENCPIPVMKVDMLNHYIDATSRKSGAGLDRAKVAERIEACKISWNEETESYDSMHPELLEKKRTKRSRRGKKKPEE
ncbi:MAG: NERD domain-containing protein [Lachnospiraceae bacterium]|nr:NERD domain-containing protein [Lachnospiraceae bacterium]